MTSKTREFILKDKIIFEKEIVRFFNINPYNSSIYIKFEINGKKHYLSNIGKIILKDIITNNENKEVNFNILEEVELKMKFKISNKFNKKEIFESFQTKMRESKVKWNQNKMKEGNVLGTGISIKDRVKMFSGEEKAKKQITVNKKPGKLKMPVMFQKSIKSSNIKNLNSYLITNKDDFKNNIKNKSGKDFIKKENNEIINDLEKIKDKSKKDVTKHDKEIKNDIKDIKNEEHKIINTEDKINFNNNDNIIKGQENRKNNNNSNSIQNINVTDKIEDKNTLIDKNEIGTKNDNIIIENNNKYIINNDNNNKGIQSKEENNIKIKEDKPESDINENNKEIEKEDNIKENNIENNIKENNEEMEKYNKIKENNLENNNIEANIKDNNQEIKLENNMKDYNMEGIVKKNNEEMKQQEENKENIIINNNNENNLKINQELEDTKLIKDNNLEKEEIKESQNNKNKKYEEKEPITMQKEVIINEQEKNEEKINQHNEYENIEKVNDINDLSEQTQENKKENNNIQLEIEDKKTEISEQNNIINIKEEIKTTENNNIIINSDIRKNKEEEINKFDENYLYEEREYNSDEEKELNDNINNLDNMNCINIDNEIQKNKNDDNNINQIYDSVTFQKKIPGVNTDNLQFQYTLKNYGSISFQKKPKGGPSFKSTSGDTFLESINYSTYLKSLQKKGLKESKRETFCEGFFIASFPYKNASVIEKSHSFPASCGHEECSKLPSMKPEIIKRYPLKDTKNLEMNNLAATICYPTGIKVCYSETKPYNIKDYITPITNQKGERYYMMTHHFYKEISRDEYEKKYEMHPLKHHLMKFGDGYIGLSEEELDQEKIKEIQTSLELCQELGFRDYLYIPYCLCIISKYPYVNELKKCLKCIYRILSKEKLISYMNPEEGNYEINNLLMYLIHSVPIPDPNSIIKFFLPYYNKRLEINCPKIEDISIMNTNTCTLLKVLSVEHIITIYKLILNEKKILFIDKYYERLAKVTDGFISLLYPLQWIHTYIPIMSDQMLKYLETFLPFLNGVHDSLMPFVKDIINENETDNEEIFLIYLNDDKIKLGSSLNGKKTKIDKYIQEKIPSLPSELEKKLKSKLKKIKNQFSVGQKKEMKDNESAELKMRDAFIDFFVGMFHDYEKYLYLLDDQEVVFNKALFLNTVPNNEKQFYDEFIDTQLFQQFTQNIIKKDFNYFYNRMALREKELVNKKDKKKKKKEKKEEKKPVILNSYVVSPIYLNIKDIEVRNIESTLRKKYPVAIKDIESERILTELAQIDDSKFINENCLIFLTPEQIKAEEGNIENKNLDLRKSAIPKFTGKVKDMKLKMNLKLSLKHTMIESDKYSEKRKEEIKEYIHDFAAKIFKSEISKVSNTEKSDLMNIIETSYGRECFINLLSYNTENIVLLQINSFKLLGNLIYNTLIGTLKIEETDKVLEQIVLLIKSTRYFAIEQKGRTITIFDSYKNKIESTPKIMQYNYWKKKYDIDLKNKENKNENIVKQQIIYKIVSEMIELEIPKSTVKTITEKISNEVFGKDSQLSKETFKVFIQQITKAHYISKARI